MSSVKTISFLLLTFSFTILVTATEVPYNQLKTNYLLPRTSFPHHYDLHLHVHPDPAYGYNGTVDINMTVVENVRKIVLHSRNLKINVKNSFLIKNDGITRYNVISMKTIPKNYFLILNFNEEIFPGNYTLHMEFTGNYYNGVNGLFLDEYSDKDGNKRYLLATHLEPVGARYIFPCFDEPNLKATFKVEVKHPKDFKAISNMPVATISSDNNITVTEFETTPKMSTYLLALGVSDYEALEAQYENKTFRVYVQPEKLNDANFALNMTVESIRHYQDLLKVNFSLPKLDSYVVPKFGGGMENWGLIVYSPSIIESNDSMATNTRQFITFLIAHEIAHQWFGDLVTLDWWNYVWLNEGFATHYALRISDMINASDRLMDLQVVGYNYDLQFESIPENAEALNRPVTFPETIGPKFGEISYHKGAAIVRFMQMTFPNYDQGITDYLKRNAYNNVEPLDLFEAINNRAEMVGDNTVKNVMDGWTSNPGYPVLTVNITQRGNFSDVIFSQERFSLHSQRSFPELWYIPITFTTEFNPDFENLTVQYWLTDKHRSTVLKLETNDGWLIANLQKSAYMRINYDLDNWKRIITYLKGPNFENIHFLNRVQLIDDSRNLATAKLLPESIVLELLSYLKQEKDEIVLQAAGKSLKEYTELLRNTEVFPKFKMFVEDLLGSDRTKSILEDPNLNKKIEETFGMFDSRFLKISRNYYEIQERLYTHKQFSKIQNTVLKNRILSAKEQTEIMANLKKKFEMNKILKQKFLNQGNYEEVKSWLNSKY